MWAEIFFKKKIRENNYKKLEKLANRDINQS